MRTLRNIRNLLLTFSFLVLFAFLLFLRGMARAINRCMKRLVIAWMMVKTKKRHRK